MTATATPTPALQSRRRDRLEASPLRHLDLVLVGATIAIAALGLLMVYSATRNSLEVDGGDPYHFLKRQALFVALGCGAMVAVLAVDYRRMRDYAPLFYGVAVAGLLAVLSPLGSNSRGSQAWIQLGSFQLQPAEFAKFFLIVALAAYLHQHRGDLDAWRLAVAVGLAAVPIGLVLLQPDIGTAMVLGVIVLGMLTAAGVNARHLFVLLALGATLVFIASRAGVIQDYQVDRLTGFLNQGDATENTYNVDQSKTAIGAGGIAGQGLFEGTQTKLDFVPEQHTDFIFTVVAEELGFVGGATLLALFAVLVWRMWRAAQLSRDLFGTLCCIGVLSMFAFQIFQSVGMTMGIMPVTGIPLPFMSHGGSSTIVAFALVGLVANVHMRRFS